MIKTKNLHILLALTKNSFYGFEMSQNVSADGFKCLETTNSNRGFLKSYDENSIISHSFKVDLKHPEQLTWLHYRLPFLFEKMVVVKW